MATSADKQEAVENAKSSTPALAEIIASGAASSTFTVPCVAAKKNLLPPQQSISQGSAAGLWPVGSSKGRCLRKTHAVTCLSSKSSTHVCKLQASRESSRIFASAQLSTASTSSGEICVCRRACYTCVFSRLQSKNLVQPAGFLLTASLMNDLLQRQTIRGGHVTSPAGRRWWLTGTPLITLARSLCLRSRFMRDSTHWTQDVRKLSRLQARQDHNH